MPNDPPAVPASARACPPHAGRTASGGLWRAAVRLGRALLLLACLAGPAFALQAPGAEPREIIAVIPANMQPLFFTPADGPPGGFAVEVLRRVAADAGYSVRFLTAANPVEAEQVLRAGKAHVFPGFGISPAREQAMDFTRPFEVQPAHIFFRAGATPLENAADLAGKRLALVAGSIPAEQLLGRPELHIRLSQTLAEAIFDVLSGEADALVFLAPTVRQAALAAGVEHKLGRSAQPLFEIGRGIAVGKSHPQLLERLDAALGAFHDTEDFRQLYRTWHPAPEKPLFPPAALWAMAALAAALTGLLLGWRYVSLLRLNRRLTLAVGERDGALAALRLTEERLEALFTLAHMEAASSEDLVEFALEQGVRLTGSQTGYLYFVNGQSVDLDQFSWSLSARQGCTVLTRLAGAPPYPLEQAGLWAEALRTQVPSIINDYPAHPKRGSLPTDHIPVLRHMGVPLVEGGSALALFGVGNKPEPYDDTDARQLQLFLSGLWRVLKARRDADAIRQARDYAESLLAGANAMIVGLDRGGRVTAFNAAAEEITGYTRGEMLGGDWFELYPRLRVEATAARFRQVMAGEAELVRHDEAPLLTKDGRRRLISWQNSLLRQGERITGLIAFGIDITEQHLAEEALAASEEKFRTLAEDSPALICRFLPDGRITYANRTYCAAFGKTVDEILGQSFLGLVPPDDREGILEHLRTFTPESPVISYEHQVSLPGGGVGWQSWTDRALFDADGALTAFQSVGMDITARKQAEADLKRLHRAIEQAAEGVLITDRDGAITYINPALERMTGLSGAEARELGLSVLEVPLAALRHQDSSVHAKEGGVWRGTSSFARPHGQQVEVEFTVSTIRDTDGSATSFVAVCRDVTEKRVLERQLWQAQKMEALGTLAGGIAHDFNNILASIMGFTELALDDIPPAGRARSSLERVLKASSRAKELVRQILTFSRRADREKRTLRADQVIGEALRLMEASLPKDIEISARLEAPGCAILADPSQIHQIVMNLCTNAAQAMRGGGRVSMRTQAVEIAADAPDPRHRLPAGQYLRFAVEDTGPGIAPEALGRIFDPFFTTKDSGEGTGLGLAVVHGIVSSLGGSVLAENKPGTGARLTVLLPTAPAGPEPAPECSQPGPGGRERILLVDDEADLLDVVRQTLEPLGYQVSAYDRPEAALDAFLACPQSFDLVLTDQIMPRLTGLQLATRLREVRPDLPVVLCTGFSMIIPPDRIQALGEAWLLSKPFSSSDLARVVREALASIQGGNHGT